MTLMSSIIFMTKGTAVQVKRDKTVFKIKYCRVVFYNIVLKTETTGYLITVLFFLVLIKGIFECYNLKLEYRHYSDFPANKIIFNLSYKSNRIFQRVTSSC